MLVYEQKQKVFKMPSNFDLYAIICINFEVFITFSAIFTSIKDFLCLTDRDKKGYHKIASSSYSFSSFNWLYFEQMPNCLLFQ